MRLGLGLGLARSTGGGGGPPASTEVAPPTLSGYAVVGQVMWVDDGYDEPATTYTRQWVSGASDPPSTPISGQTGPSITVPSIAGNYIACLVTPANGQPARLSDVMRVHAATMTAPVLLRTSTSGGSPFTYTVTYDNTVFADDVEHVQYATDPAFVPGSILWTASRGLTEAAFEPPYLSDDSADADPAWSTAPPTFTGTYFVQRWVSTIDGFVVSPKSNVESNVTLDLTVRADPAASWNWNSGDKYTFSTDRLTFTGSTDYRQHVGRVNYARTGDRTAELTIDTTPANYNIGFGFDDGTFDWSTGASQNDKESQNNGWKGFVVYAYPTSVNSYKANGTTTTAGPSANSGQGFTGWQAGDVMRIRYTPGTFTADVPDNNGVAVCTRIRAGVETAALTVTGIASMTSAKIIFMSRFGPTGTFKFTGLTPAINVASQEYQA